MTKYKTYLNYAAIISMFITGAMGTLENSAIQTIIEAWPHISSATIRLMITLPSLVSMLVMVGIGRFVGTKVSYRTVSITGFLCVLIGGLVPFFIHQNWTFILVCRALLGIGVGLFSVRNPLLMRTVKQSELAKFIGIGGVIGSLCSVIINPIVGFLTTLGWNYAFLSNLLVLIPGLLSLLFLQEPPILEVETKQTTKSKLPTTIYFYIFIQFIATMVLYPMLSGISSYLTEIDIASPTVAGYMLSIYTAGGIVSNLLLSKLQLLLKDKLLWLALSLPMLGCLLVIFSQNIILIALGIFMSGTGFTLAFSTLQVYTGLVCDDQNIAQASLLILAINQLGVFLSSYFIEITAHLPIFELAMKNTYLACAFSYFVILTIVVVFRKTITPTKH